MWSLMLVAALQVPSAPDLPLPRDLPPVDLDGDGRPERMRMQRGGIVVGDQELPCVSMEEGECSIEVVDFDRRDPQRHLLVCWNEPGRGTSQCGVYAYAGGALAAIDDLRIESAELRVVGDGIVSLSGAYDARFTEQTVLLLWDGKHATRVPQPLFATTPAAQQRVALEATLDVWDRVEGNVVVARAAAGSSITFLARDATNDGWYLLRTATGLVGYAHIWEISKASLVVRARYSAG